jgi:hypothetical protein
MDGNFERSTPDPQAWPAPGYGGPDYGVPEYATPGAPDGRLAEAIQRFEDALWYLEAAATPEEILVNLPTVLSTAGALLVDDDDEHTLSESREWQTLSRDTADETAFLTARDQVVRDGWQLDGVARSWLSEVVDPSIRRHALGELSLGAAGARLTLRPD